MNERWMWVLRYVIVIVLALALAWALGDMALFKTTRFGKTGLTAARLAQLLGYGGALVVFWLLAQRAAELIGPEHGRWLLVKPMMLPLATLADIAMAHRSEEHTSELQSRLHLVCRLLLEKKKKINSKQG